MSSSPNDPVRHCAEQPELTDLQSNAERRRMLLKGLGKGSAIAAAAVPIKSMAATALTTDGRLCTISGVASGVRSNKTGTTTCVGKSFDVWKVAGSWPKDANNLEVVNNGTSDFLRSSTTFGAVFSDGTKTSATYNMATLFASGLTKATATDEAHWLVALLNAKSYGSAFPYTAAQIVALYTDPLKRAAAIAFFKNYMESVTA